MKRIPLRRGWICQGDRENRHGCPRGRKGRSGRRRRGPGRRLWSRVGGAKACEEGRIIFLDLLCEKDL